MGKRYGNVGSELNIIDRNCIDCKYHKVAEKDNKYTPITAGYCKLSYCKRNVLKQRKTSKR